MGISWQQLLIILVIVLLLFGTKRLRNLGGDLGSAIKGFRKAMKGEDEGEGDDKDKEKDEEQHRITRDDAHKVEKPLTSDKHKQDQEK